MVVGVDQAGKDQVVGQIEDFVGAFGKRTRRADLLDPPIPGEQTAIADLSAAGIHGDEPLGMVNQKGRHATSGGGAKKSNIPAGMRQLSDNMPVMVNGCWLPPAQARAGGSWSVLVLRVRVAYGRMRGGGRSGVWGKGGVGEGDRRVFWSKRVMVIRPAPPGDGEIAPATSIASSKSTPPTWR